MPFLTTVWCEQYNIFSCTVLIFSFVVFFYQFELLRIGCGWPTDGPDCESSRKYEEQDAELGQAARTYQWAQGIF